LGLRGLPKTTLKLLLHQHRGVSHLRARPQLSKELILRWADAHHAQTGMWPRAHSGPVLAAPGETWKNLDSALFGGTRGLPGGDTLARLLATHRGVPAQQRNRTPLTEKQILGWVDAHRRRTHQWPNASSGKVHGTLHETWHGVAKALFDGSRGLPGGQTLRQFLAEHRGVRNRKKPPPLNFVLILTWADAFHKRKGRWPTHKDGRIKEAPGETWCAVNSALILCKRGMRNRMSLAKFLARHRGVRYRPALPPLTIEQILRWADSHRERTGAWPSYQPFTEPVHDAPGETWGDINQCLRMGRRGLPGGTTLKSLLSRHRGLRSKRDLPRLTVEQIVQWADDHMARTGKWPKTRVGEKVLAAPGETWSGINVALNAGLRGLPGKDSVARVLARHRGARNHLALPKLSVEQILKWADAYKERTGKWPTRDSGPVQESPTENWSAIEGSLRAGVRGLPGGQSLARVLAEHRGKRLHTAPPKLSVKLIQKWAKAHRKRTGKWPRRSDGSIREAPGETWNGIHLALRVGRRGLRGGSSLPRLLAQCRGG
jgi:hypothetical protein